MTKMLNDFVRHTVLIALGSAVCALAVKGILIPQGFLARGLTGAALIVHYCHPALPVGAVYLVMNIPVFGLGWRFVGLRFVLYSLWGMILYSVINRKHISLLKRVVLEKDPSAFVAIMTAGDVTGVEVGNQPHW